MSDLKKTSKFIKKRVALCKSRRKPVVDSVQLEESLARERNLLLTVINSIPEYIYIKDAKSRFILCNATSVSGIDVASADEIIGKTDFDFYPREMASKYFADESKIIKTGKPLINKEEVCLDKKGEKIWLLTTKVPLRDTHGKIIGIIGFGRDITEKKKAQESLARSEAIYRKTIENARGVPYELCFEDGQYSFIGDGIEDLVDIPRHKVTRQNLRSLVEEIIFPDPNVSKNLLKVREALLRRDMKTADRHIDAYNDEISRGLADYHRSDFRIRTPKGQVKWISDRSIHIRDEKTGKAIGSIGILQDITERKDTEEALKKAKQELEIKVEERTHELKITNEQLKKEIAERKKAEKRLLDYQEQLRSLASELLLSEERLKRRVAINVHDNISQHLAISKIKIESLKESAPSCDAAKKLEEVRDLIAQTIVYARSLTFELSPPVLYELGFEPALEWLVRQTRQQYGIAAEFSDDGRKKPLDNNVRVLLFQAVRELLVNIAKHAHAHNVKVSVQKIADQINIIVEDDGVGFDVSAQSRSQDCGLGHFGLFSIRERLDYIAGHIDIHSKPGRGTRITLSAPLEPRKKVIKGTHK